MTPALPYYSTPPAFVLLVPCTRLVMLGGAPIPGASAWSGVVMALDLGSHGPYPAHTVPFPATRAT